MRSFMLVKVWKSICIISLAILLVGCNNMYYDYDYREEEQSKMQVNQEGDAGEPNYPIDAIAPPTDISSEIVSIDDTIYDGDTALMYGYSMMINKAYVYFALTSDGYFENVVFTLEQYDKDKRLIDTVTTDSINCLGCYPVKAYFESSKNVQYVKLVGIDFSCDVEDFIDSDMYTFDEKGTGISFTRLSNTTFEYKSKFDGVIGFLDQNGVQIDSKSVEIGKGTIVTVQEVDSYKIFRKK